MGFQSKEVSASATLESRVRDRDRAVLYQGPSSLTWICPGEGHHVVLLRPHSLGSLPVVGTIPTQGPLSSLASSSNESSSSVLVRVSMAVTKHSDRNNLERRGFILPRKSRLTIHHWRK